MSKKSESKILDLLEAFDWMFQTMYHSRSVVIKDQDDENKAAEIFFRKEYQDMELSIYPCFFKQDAKKQRKNILHELCHTLTLPGKQAMHDLLDGKLVTADMIQSINEEETSRIENIIDSLLKGRMDYARKAYDQYLPKKTHENKLRGHRVSKKVVLRKKPRPDRSGHDQKLRDKVAVGRRTGRVLRLRREVLPPHGRS